MNSAGISVDQPFVFSPSLVADVSAEGAPPTGPPRPSSLVNEVRREITEIIREVAQAASEDKPEGQFLNFVADRVLRAMAAEGVVIWGVPSATMPTHTYNAVARIGRITDRSLDELSARAHQRLLTEVGAEQQPVVVPPTAEAAAEDEPANPSEVAVAIVPIQSDPTTNETSHLIEVFLEPECGVATQRGYLRFVAQMADLTGEFLRKSRFRQLRRRQERSAIVDKAIEGLHAADSAAAVESFAVDSIAEIFGVDRVGLCWLDDGRARLAAVSHVDVIDRRSPDADQIRLAAECHAETDGRRVIVPEDPQDKSENGLRVIAVVVPDESSSLRCVLLTRPDRDIDIGEDGDALLRLVRHVNLAHRSAGRRSHSIGGRLLAPLAPSTQLGRTRWRRPVLTVACAALLLIACMIPLPMVIVTDATIRPANVQRISAPRDVTVQQVHVRHGQLVSSGDRLVTLADTDLQQEIVALTGRRAVLSQQQSRWVDAIVGAESSFGDGNDRLQTEKLLVDEEIRSIDHQLTLLRAVEQSLVVCADRDGTVDAWRIDDRLSGRPMRRGDYLLQVVADDSPWLVDAQVPQKRIAQLEASLRGDLDASVGLVSRPEQTQAASMVRIGPATDLPHDGQPATIVVLQLDHEALDADTTFRDANVQSGAPARVRFRCGTAPAAYLIFQDVIQTVRGRLAIYAGGGNVDTGGPS